MIETSTAVMPSALPRAPRWRTGGRVGLRRHSWRIRALVGIGTAIVIGILAVTVLVILEVRAREIGDAEQALMRLDLLLAEQTDRTIQSVDLILQGIVDELHSGGVGTADAYRQAASGTDMFRELKSRVIGVPQLDAVTLIGADGDLLNFSRYYPIPHVNVADRDYFKALRSEQRAQIFLSDAVENRGTGTLNVYLARRFAAPNGEFLGLVLGAMQVSYFQHLYDELRISPGMNITLRRSDGALLAFRTGSGQSVPQTRSPLPDGATLEPAGADDAARVVASRTLQDYPITIAVTETLDEVLAEWRHDATAIGLGGLASAGAVALLIWALLRQLRSYDALAGALDARDAAERRRGEAEDQLRQAQKMEAVGQLTAGLAHDFNNLLMSISGCIESMEAQAPEGEMARRIGVIRQATERGGLLTRQLLAFSRKQMLLPRRVDLNAVLRDTGELLQGTLGGTVRITLRLRPDLWDALVDPGQLEHTILNLVINARDAMPGGGFVIIETQNVTLAAGEGPEDMPAGDYVRIAVIDSGTGMPPEVVARAFDPFFTTKSVGTGSGLGLSQAYGFARQSGGGIAIESEPGQGTTILLWLRRATETDLAEPASAAAEPHEPAPEGYLPTGAITLLVDDDTAVRETIATILAGAGLQVLEAPDGPAALLQLDTAGRIDLLVVDYGMPGMNGAELARHVRARQPGLPVIFITGYVDAGLLDGERYRLQKPFRGHELIELAGTALWESGRQAAGV
jgi:signal transduction histidine kinase/CheY-like chemotaxis protein